MFYQVGVSHDHIKDVASPGFHLTLYQNALAVWHHHVQLSLGGWRFPLFWLQIETFGDVWKFGQGWDYVEIKDKKSTYWLADFNCPVGNRLKWTVKNRRQYFQIFMEIFKSFILTTIDPGNSKATCGSSNILINSGPNSYDIWAKQRQGDITYYYIYWTDNAYCKDLAHLYFPVIQTRCGIKLCQGSQVGTSITIQVRTARTSVQLLPAAVSLSVSSPRGNPGKNEFSLFSPRWKSKSVTHETKAFNQKVTYLKFNAGVFVVFVFPAHTLIPHWFCHWRQYWYFLLILVKMKGFGWHASTHPAASDVYEEIFFFRAHVELLNDPPGKQIGFHSYAHILTWNYKFASCWAG